MLLSSGAGLQQILIDSYCCRATRGLRKFWPDCMEVQHTLFLLKAFSDASQPTVSKILLNYCPKCPKKLCCAISRKVSVKLFWFLLIFVCIDALYCYAVFVLLYRSSVIKNSAPKETKSKRRSFHQFSCRTRHRMRQRYTTETKRASQTNYIFWLPTCLGIKLFHFRQTAAVHCLTAAMCNLRKWIFASEGAGAFYFQLSSLVYISLFHQIMVAV